MVCTGQTVKLRHRGPVSRYTFKLTNPRENGSTVFHFSTASGNKGNGRECHDIPWVVPDIPGTQPTLQCRASPQIATLLQNYWCLDVCVSPEAEAVVGERGYLNLACPTGPSQLGLLIVIAPSVSRAGNRQCTQKTNESPNIQPIASVNRMNRCSDWVKTGTREWGLVQQAKLKRPEISQVHSCQRHVSGGKSRQLVHSGVCNCIFKINSHSPKLSDSTLIQQATTDSKLRRQHSQAIRCLHR